MVCCFQPFREHFIKDISKFFYISTKCSIFHPTTTLFKKNFPSDKILFQILDRKIQDKSTKWNLPFLK
jgi:hypothetical protein